MYSQFQVGCPKIATRIHACAKFPIQNSRRQSARMREFSSQFLDNQPEIDCTRICTLELWNYILPTSITPLIPLLMIIMKLQRHALAVNAPHTVNVQSHTHACHIHCSCSTKHPRLSTNGQNLHENSAWYQAICM